MLKVAAPYANTAIAVHLQSVTGTRYRLLSCVECSREFFERQGESFYRIGVVDMPEDAHVGVNGGIDTRCGNCSQSYTVFFATTVTTYRNDAFTYQQPQTIFLAAEVNKSERNTYCLECHHAYLTLSDRITMISDDAVPQALTIGMGPLEVRCKSQKCKQRWQIRM